MENKIRIVAKIEIMEQWHCIKNDKVFNPVDKIERTVTYNGEEIYREIIEPRRKSGSALSNFMEWVLFRCQPKECSNNSEVGKNGRKPFSTLRKIFGKRFNF